MTTIDHSLYDLDITLIEETRDLGNLVKKLYDCDYFALDCEFVDLGRNRKISLMNFTLEDGSIYLVDLQKVRLINRLKDLLSDGDIKKVMFDCRADADCLKRMAKVDLRGIEDLQVMKYVIQHPNLEAAHILPAYTDVLIEYMGPEQTDDLNLYKPSKNQMKKWGIRPLKQSLLDYSSLEISSFLPIKSELIEELPYDISNIHRWSQLYASSRVDNKLFSRNNPFQSHHFMELGILTDLKSGDVVRYIYVSNDEEDADDMSDMSDYFDLEASCSSKVRLQKKKVQKGMEYSPEEMFDKNVRKHKKKNWRRDQDKYD